MKDFDKIIWRDALTLVDFFATWCGPCQMMHPILERLKAQMNGRIDIYKIDIDSAEDAEVVAHYNIMSVPTLIIFRRGEVLWRESGRISYDHLQRIVEELERHELAIQR